MGKSWVFSLQIHLVVQGNSGTWKNIPWVLQCRMLFIFLLTDHDTRLFACLVSSVVIASAPRSSANSVHGVILVNTVIQQRLSKGKVRLMLLFKSTAHLNHSSLEPGNIVMYQTNS